MRDHLPTPTGRSAPEIPSAPAIAPTCSVAQAPGVQAAVERLAQTTVERRAATAELKAGERNDTCRERCAMYDHRNALDALEDALVAALADPPAPSPMQLAAARLERTATVLRAARAAFADANERADADPNGWTRASRCLRAARNDHRAAHEAFDAALDAAAAAAAAEPTTREPSQCT